MEQNFAYVIPTEDAILHRTENPFCYDGSCGCHEDKVLITEIAEFVQQGLLTPEEATDFVAGKMV